jgi:hypothetical protein
VHLLRSVTPTQRIHITLREYRTLSDPGHHLRAQLFELCAARATEVVASVGQVHDHHHLVIGAAGGSGARIGSPT